MDSRPDAQDSRPPHLWYEWIAPPLVAGMMLLLGWLPFFQRLENLVVDQRIRSRAQHQPAPDPRAIFVTIDDLGIKTLGRWPWSRDVHGDFTQLAAQEKPAVIVWDLLMDVPSRAEDDQHLIQSIQSSGIPAIFGVVAMKMADTGSLSANEALPGWPAPPGLDLSRIPEARSLLGSFPALGAVTASGLVNADPGPDGIIRTMPMVMRHQNHLIPSLSLAALMAYWNLQPAQVRVVPGDAIYLESPVVRRRIPVDDSCGYQVNYRYELDDLTRVQPPRSLSYLLLLRGLVARHIENDRAASVPDIRQKILLIGQASTALSDVGPSPRAEQSPRPLMHMNVLDNVLKEDYLKTLPPLAFWSGFVLFGWASLLTLRLGGFWLTALSPLLIVPAYILAAFALFNHASLLLPVMGPALGFTALQVGAIGSQVLREQMARRSLRRAFSVYVSPAVLDSIYKNPDQIQLGGAAREVAILFADIRSFTTMTEEMDARDLVTQLNEYFTAMVAIVHEHHGSLHKYIGDAIMAVWGDVTRDGPGVDTGQALRAALAMRRTSTRLNRLWAEQNRPPFRIGIGLNHGRVIAGNIGAPQRVEFTVVGDAVNLASRIEGLTKKFALPIVVGETIHDLALERFAFRPLSKVRVTGKTIPVRIYEPLYEFGQEADCPYDLEWLRLYHEAFTRFEEHRWEVAIRLFEACLQGCPDDRPSQMLLEFCRDLVKNPPPIHWDGAFEFESK